jgi:hypothetical protein
VNTIQNAIAKRPPTAYGVVFAAGVALKEKQITKQKTKKSSTYM